MNILGINCFSHDTAACLLSDGKVVAFAEEERFNRDKHTKAFPVSAIDYCLDAGNIDIRDIDIAAFAHQPGIDMGRAMADIVRRLPGTWRRLLLQPAVDFNLYLRKPVFRVRQGFVGRLIFVGHHEAHAAASFFASPFEEAAVLSIDRGGDYLSTWLGYGQANQLKQLSCVSQPHSIGEVYAAVTDYLGFMPNCDEGKVMGLAPYGDSTYVDRFNRLIATDAHGGFVVDLDYFTYHRKAGWCSPKFIGEFGPRRLPNEEIGLRHQDIAAAVQTTTERAALELADYLSAATKSKNICLAGGVALNSCMNAKILLKGKFNDIFIQPAAGDAGNALGAAYHVWHVVLGNKRVAPLEDAYLGPEYTDSRIIEAIKSAGLEYHRQEDVARYCAARINEGKIVGWFQGRAEAGPRALGNRSILANATRADTKDIVNLKIKKRESFRPFAPGIQAEHAADYIDDYYPSPYMLLVMDVKRSRRASVPSITHVDGTARLQTVTKASNPRYWSLIDEFRRLSGIPVVLNTSFNVMGEPIVSTPADAIRTFRASGMDCLALGDYIIEKQPGRNDHG